MPIDPNAARLAAEQRQRDAKTEEASKRNNELFELYGDTDLELVNFVNDSKVDHDIKMARLEAIRAVIRGENVGVTAPVAPAPSEEPVAPTSSPSSEAPAAPVAAAPSASPAPSEEPEVVEDEKQSNEKPKSVYQQLRELWKNVD